MPDWMKHRFWFGPLIILPLGWQGEFAPGYTLPTGIELPGDYRMSREMTDGERIRNIFKGPSKRWKHQAVIRTKDGQRHSGYLCYRFSGGTWRIRVRVGVEEFLKFKANLSRQPTRMALVNLEGGEIPLEIVNSKIRFGTLPEIVSY